VARGDWRAAGRRVRQRRRCRDQPGRWVDRRLYWLAPIYLPQDERQEIAVPIGSILNLRAHGASHAPGVSIGDMHPPALPERRRICRHCQLTHEARAVQASGTASAIGICGVIPDRVPVIAFTQPAIGDRTRCGEIRLQGQ